MGKFIFSLGLVDKRLFIPLLNSVNYIIISVLLYYYPQDDVNIFIDYGSFAIGEILVIILPSIFKFQNRVSEGKKFSKNNIKDFSILFVINLILILMDQVSAYIKDSTVDMLCCIEGLEIILICIITALFLKYKYYLHHIISLACFLIMCLLIDAISQNYQGHRFAIIITKIIYLIVEVIYYCYIKYMMEKKYHHFWNIIFSLGIQSLMSYVSIFFILLHIRNNYGTEGVLTNINSYYNKDAAYFVVRSLLGIIFGGFFQYLLEFETINIFTPNHAFVCYELSKLSQIILKAQSQTNYYFCLFPFCFQVIFLLFYLEILEFNFCGLNRNTKKNIQIREREDKEENFINAEKDDDNNNDNIEFTTGYTIKNITELQPLEDDD